MDNDDQKKVIKFPDIKAERDEQARRIAIMERAMYAVTSDRYVTVVGEHIELRVHAGGQHYPVGSFPLGQFEKLLFLTSVLTSAKVMLLEEAVKKLGGNVEEILGDEKLTEMLIERFTRPAD